MGAPALALCSSLLYGLSDFLGGIKSRALPLLVVLVISQSAGLALLAIAVAALGFGPPGGDYAVYGLAAGVCEAVAIASFYRGLAVGKMGIVTPVASTAPVIAVAVGIAIGEYPEALQWLGIGLAAAGVTAISLGGGSGGKGGSAGPSVVLGVLAALGFGGFLVTIDAASEGGVAWALVTARVTSVTVFAIAFALTRPSTAAVRRSDLPVLALVGVLIVGADAMFALATTRGVLGVVAVLGSLYPVVTIALAHRFLGERLDRRQALGVATCLAGVVAIVL